MDKLFLAVIGIWYMLDKYLLFYFVYKDHSFPFLLFPGCVGCVCASQCIESEVDAAFCPGGDKSGAGGKNLLLCSHADVTILRR